MNTHLHRIVVALAVLGLAAPAFGAEVDRRLHRQQSRIAEGMESGQLTPGEAARLEKRDARIHQEIHRDRVANGGKLTAAEKRQINHEENRTSRQIYRAKHNVRHM